jgi:hypothetical protein
MLMLSFMGFPPLCRRSVSHNLVYELFVYELSAI